MDKEDFYEYHVTKLGYLFVFFDCVTLKIDYNTHKKKALYKWYFCDVLLWCIIYIWLYVVWTLHVNWHFTFYFDVETHFDSLFKFLFCLYINLFGNLRKDKSFINTMYYSNFSVILLIETYSCYWKCKYNTYLISIPKWIIIDMN